MRAEKRIKSENKKAGLIKVQPFCSIFVVLWGVSVI